MSRKLRRGQKWWRSLSKSEQQSYIEKRERSRHSTQKRGKDETWTNAGGTFVKTWIDDNSFSVVRLSDIDTDPIRWITRQKW